MFDPQGYLGSPGKRHRTSLAILNPRTMKLVRAMLTRKRPH